MSETKKPRIITLATIKGGVGKTVLATHLAAALAEKRIPTLLVDLDPQGHATLLSGVDAALDAPCVGDALQPPKAATPLAEAIVDLGDNLSVAPALLRMAMLERQLYPWALRLGALQRALSSLGDRYRAVVIDTPPHIGAYTECALHVAHLTVAPLPAMSGALQGFADLRYAWAEMQDGRGGHLTGAINLWDQRTSATNTAFIDELNAEDIPLMRARVPRSEAINQAALCHSILYDTQPSHPAAEQLRAFATEAWKLASKVKA